MTKVAVILSGCGFLDGAEIREAVLTLLYLDQAGAQVNIYAPNINQHHVVNHLTQEEVSETRNVMEEAARIARGKVTALSGLDANAYDALLIPGGYGVAKNLSSLAFDGPNATVHEDFAKAVKAFHEQKKPIGAICIAPAVLALILKGSGAKLTIGEDAGTAELINTVGCAHENAASQAVVIDEEQRVASCSAYMREDHIAPIAQGIEKVVKAVMSMAA